VIDSSRFQRLALWFAGSAALSAALLWLAVRGLELTLVCQIATTARWDCLVLAALLGTLSLWLRASRWQLLLHQLHIRDFASIYWATSVAAFANLCVPRTGDIVRTVRMSAVNPAASPYIVATVVAEKLADVLGLLSLAVTAAITAPEESRWLMGIRTPLLVLGAICATLLVAGATLSHWTARVFTNLPIGPRLRALVLDSLRQLSEGLGALHQLRRASAFLALSVLMWCVELGGVIATAAAVGISAPTAAACLFIAGLGFGSLLPTAPLQIGLYQLVAISALTPFGTDRPSALAFSLVAQATTLAVVAVWGTLGLAFRGIKGSRP